MALSILLPAAAFACLALACAALRRVRYRLRYAEITSGQEKPPERLPVPEIAFLAGGPLRVVDTALVRMHAEERLAVSRGATVTLFKAGADDPVEQAVEHGCGPAHTAPLARLRTAAAVAPEVQEIGDRLVGYGLLRRPDTRRQVGRAGGRATACVLGAAACVAVLAVRGAGFWPICVAAVALVATAAVASRVPKRPALLTPAGRALLAEHRERNPWQTVGVILTDPRTARAAAVALGGVAALTWDDALRSVLTGGAGAATVTAGGGSSSPSWCGSGGFTAGGDAGWDGGGSHHHGDGGGGGGHHTGGGGGSHHHGGCGGSSCGGGCGSGGCGGGGSSCGGGSGCGGS